MISNFAQFRLKGRQFKNTLYLPLKNKTKKVKFFEKSISFPPFRHTQNRTVRKRKCGFFSLASNQFQIVGYTYNINISVAAKPIIPKVVKITAPAPFRCFSCDG